MEYIIHFFTSIGYPLEHFPDDGESIECWEFDGGLDGVVINITQYINPLRKKSVRVEIDILAGECFCDSFPIKDLKAAVGRDDFEAWARKCLSAMDCRNLVERASV